MISTRAANLSRHRRGERHEERGEVQEEEEDEEVQPAAPPHRLLAGEGRSGAVPLIQGSVCRVPDSENV